MESRKFLNITRFLWVVRLRVALACATLLGTYVTFGEATLALEPGAPLSLPRALELTLAGSPELRAAGFEVRAAQAEVAQAGVLPNPELEIEAEEFGGSGSRSGTDAIETTVMLSQTLELGGKRARRRQVAHAAGRLVELDYETARLEALTGTRHAYIDVLATQAEVALTTQSLALARTARDAVMQRAAAGKVPELATIQAEATVKKAEIAQEQSRRDLTVARRTLAACWGAATDNFGDVAGSLDALPEFTWPEIPLPTPPEVASARAAGVVADARLALARTQRLPDVTLSAGVRRFKEGGTRAYVAGLAVPLPLFDRNRGAIEAAAHQLAAARERERAAALQATVAQAEAHSRLEAARRQALALRDDLLPAAQRALAAARTGFTEGKFDFLEVLDAQRTLQETRENLLEAQIAFHKAAADLERRARISLQTIFEP